MLRDLWDWRRRVAAMYAAVRAEADPEVAWLLWRQNPRRAVSRAPAIAAGS